MPGTPSPSPAIAPILGLPWDADTLTAIVAVAALLWSAFNFFWARHRMSVFEARSIDDADRDQHRLQLNDATWYALSSDPKFQKVGLARLAQLKVASWATDEDRLTTAAVLDAIAEG